MLGVGMKELILKYAPVWLQNLAITIYNTMQYRMRRGGAYRQWRKYYLEADSLTMDEIAAIQNERLSEFLLFARSSSDWYSSSDLLSGLNGFGVLEKKHLIENLNEISTIKEKAAVVSYTGGTTGASMKVYYTKDDVRQRQALLDHFRSGYGYVLGKKTAWFSGKSLVRDQDLARGICYRDDWVNRIRFFSTFNISPRSFDAYWTALVGFQPEYIVGFPSSVFDICVIAKQRGLKYSGEIKAFFPTAETVLPIHREVIGDVLGCRLVDQYASSEGAPFILECKAGSKHIHPLSGVFEVVDSDLNEAVEGELLVTSFTTHGTPLIRYRVGDRVKLADPGFVCTCGSVFPVVESIDGRTSDFVLSREKGRVNLGNISNCTKGVKGMVCFQIRQYSVDEIAVSVVANDSFDDKNESVFIAALRERVGLGMRILLERVDDIPREKSGKFRFVKNLMEN